MNSMTDSGARALAEHPDVASVEVRPESDGATSFHVVPSAAFRAPAIGIFYFSDQDSSEFDRSYQLCLEGAVRADKAGLDAVWTPERHFTSVGAASPNPSVLAAAIAVLTRQIRIRAGSVVLPLHHPIRVAEEWAIVDRLSGGRAGVSFASGWVPDDFVFDPEAYARRREVLAGHLAQVRDLWAGKALPFRNGTGQLADISIRPRPVQVDMPVWLTAVGSSDTFELAGKSGVNVLTALLQMSADQLAENIMKYREARAAAGYDPRTGNVTVMVHTYVSADADEARREARPPLREYFIAQSALRSAVAKDAGKLPENKAQISDRLLDYSVDKFIRERSFIGSVDTTQDALRSLEAIGADEFACLIDFGVAPGKMLNGIDYLSELKSAPHRQLEDRLKQLTGGARVRVERSSR